MRWTVVLGLAALFLGGVLGGWLAGSLGSPGEIPDAEPAFPAGPSGSGADPVLEEALRELTREVRRLRESLPDGVSTSRTEVPVSAEINSERLVAALEALARALDAGRRPGSGSGYVSTPLIIPQGEPRRDLITNLRDQDDEARSHAHRFLTYQEVLDRFGKPDYVWEGGRWVYEDPASGKQTEFDFEDGLLIAIY